MTGYGKAVKELDNKIITVELRTLNSKQTDIYTKIPYHYKSKDPEIRNIISRSLFRGKIELYTNVEYTREIENVKINKNAIKQFYKQLKSVADELDINEDSFLQTIMRLPETIVKEEEDFDETEWLEYKKLLNVAIDDVIKYRKQEGEALYNDMQENIKNIKQLLAKVDKPEKERIERIKHKIKGNLNDLFNTIEIDKNRFEQELLYYIEKLDINEEKVRLKMHCEFFIETMKTDSPNGKKLGFISQEMGREINTIGSKANDSDIQNIVVKMKEEQEKIKEQIMNVL